MPTDFPGILYGKLIATHQSGVANYNADILSGVLTRCKSVAADQVLDDRPPLGGLPGRTVEKFASRAPADYPQIRLQITGSSRLTSPTKTFALAAGASGADAVRPITLTFIQTITHDTVLDSGQTPLEAYLDAALDAQYPKLGLTYCRDFECIARRSDEMIKDKKRTVRRNTITVRLWPHLSQL